MANSGTSAKLRQAFKYPDEDDNPSETEFIDEEGWLFLFE
jgi:hypothetical protein